MPQVYESNSYGYSRYEVNFPMFPNWSNSVSLQQELYISEGLYSRRFIMIECDHGMKNIFYRRFSPIIPLTIARYFVSTPVKIYFEGEIERIR